MDKYFVDVKELSKSKYTRSNYLYEDNNAQMLRRAHVMPELNRKSSEIRKSSSKKLSRDNREEYETDCRKRIDTERDLELSQLRRLVSECEHCRSRVTEFITKKPKYQISKVVNAEVQTTSLDPNLFLMLEEKIQEINRYNKHTVKELKKMEELVHLKEEELDELEERFTGVVYKVSEDIFLFDRIHEEYNHMKTLASLSTQMPSFLKCLALDDTIQANNHG